jgi:uncharacterized protein YdeI (YjbR/CyaY-like superfamily)
LGFEEHDLVAFSSEKVSGGQAADPGSDDGDLYHDAPLGAQVEAGPKRPVRPDRDYAPFRPACQAAGILPGLDTARCFGENGATGVPHRNAAPEGVMMKAPIEPTLFKDREAWRRWLAANHGKAAEIWLAYYKKGTGKKSVSYEEALDEALCYGWIDSIVKALDGERYMQRWTPRQPGSVWSASNKKRLARLAAQGRMCGAGLAKVRAAKRDGSWATIDAIDRDAKTPAELLDALAARPGAREKFEGLAPSQKKLWGWWIQSAKRPETRARRIAAAVEWILAGRKIGIETPRLASEGGAATGRPQKENKNQNRGRAKLSN